MDRKRAWRWTSRTLIALLVVVGATSRAPAMLAFPHHARIGTTEVYAEQPIAPQLRGELARADALIAASPLAGGDLTRTLFLTDGGWRWRVLALTSGDALAFRRPFSSALIFNRTDVVHDRTAGGWRSLSGTIAHETTHLLVARRLGELAAVQAPAWVNEGFADVVARESPLTDAEAARFKVSDPGARRLFYYDARRRVAAALKVNGGSIEALYH